MVEEIKMDGEMLMGEVVWLSQAKARKFYRLLNKQPKMVRLLVELVIEQRDLKAAAKLIVKGMVRGHCQRFPEEKEENYSSFVEAELGVSVGLPYVLLSLRFVYQQFVEQHSRCLRPFPPRPPNHS